MMAEAGAIKATCHCGRASITLPRKPEQVTQCNCSLCTKTGFRGVYFGSDELVIEGEFDCYVLDRWLPTITTTTTNEKGEKVQAKGPGLPRGRSRRASRPDA